MFTNRSSMFVFITLLVISIFTMSLPAKAAGVDVSVFNSHNDFVGTFNSPNIAFGTDTNWDWHPFGLNCFSALFEGCLQVDSTGVYQFTTTGDSSLVNIPTATSIEDNKFFLDNLDPYHFSFTYTYEGNGPAGVDLLWRGPGFPDTNDLSYTLIPADNLVDCDVACTPEPLSFGLLGAGLFPLLGKLRRK